MSEKIRIIIVAKRKDLTIRLATREDDNINEFYLREWLDRQTSFRLDEFHDCELNFKTTAANTLIKLYGDPILMSMYKEDNKLSKGQRYEKMLDEILFDMKARYVRSLSDDDSFGE